MITHRTSDFPFRVHSLSALGRGLGVRCLRPPLPPLTSLASVNEQFGVNPIRANSRPFAGSSVPFVTVTVTVNVTVIFGHFSQQFPKCYVVTVISGGAPLGASPRSLRPSCLNPQHLRNSHRNRPQRTATNCTNSHQFARLAPTCGEKKLCRCRLGHLTRRFTLLTPPNGKSRLVTPFKKFSPKPLPLSLNSLSAVGRGFGVRCSVHNPTRDPDLNLNLNASALMVGRGVPAAPLAHSLTPKVVNRTSQIVNPHSLNACNRIEATVTNCRRSKNRPGSAHLALTAGLVNRKSYIVNSASLNTRVDSLSALGRGLGVRCSNSNSALSPLTSRPRSYSAPISAIQRCSALIFIRADRLNLNAFLLCASLRPLCSNALNLNAG